MQKHRGQEARRKYGELTRVARARDFKTETQICQRGIWPCLSDEEDCTRAAKTGESPHAREELFQNSAVQKAGLALKDGAFLGQGQIEKETDNAAHTVDSLEGQGQGKQRKGRKTTGADGEGGSLLG